MSNSAISYAQLLRSELETLKNDSTKMFERIQRLEAHVQVLEDHIRLLTQFNERLRSALKEYNPIHPLLSESIPAIPDVL